MAKQSNSARFRPLRNIPELQPSRLRKNPRDGRRVSPTAGRACTTRTDLAVLERDSMLLAGSHGKAKWQDR